MIYLQIDCAHARIESLPGIHTRDAVLCVDRYDNEYGYCSRMIDVAATVAKHMELA